MVFEEGQNIFVNFFFVCFFCLLNNNKKIQLNNNEKSLTFKRILEGITLQTLLHSVSYEYIDKRLTTNHNKNLE